MQYTILGTKNVRLWQVENSSYFKFAKVKEKKITVFFSKVFDEINRKTKYKFVCVY